jgi:hypothetical protein
MCVQRSFKGWGSSMKTHQLARNLRILGELLLSGPNVDLQNLSLASRRLVGTSPRSSIGLHTLLDLSKVTKREWLEVVDKHGIPIEIRQRDAARDILHKLLRFLADNEEAYRGLRASGEAVGEEASEELLQSLNGLLRGTKYENNASTPLFAERDSDQ